MSHTRFQGTEYLNPSSLNLSAVLFGGAASGFNLEGATILTTISAPPTPSGSSTTPAPTSAANAATWLDVQLTAQQKQQVSLTLNEPLIKTLHSSHPSSSASFISTSSASFISTPNHPTILKPIPYQLSSPQSLQSCYSLYSVPTILITL